MAVGSSINKEKENNSSVKDIHYEEEDVKSDCIINKDDTTNEKADNEKQEKKKSKKGKNKEEDKSKDENSAQDVEFSVNIQPPSGQSFEIKVSTLELVQEIHQLLMDREDTCHRTCFCLTLNDQVLDNFTELKSIDGMKEGAVIKIVERPYTTREARIHVRHVRDLLKSLETTDAYNGVEGASLSFLSAITQRDVLDRRAPESIDCTPPEYIIPGNNQRPLLPLQPFAKEQKSPKCLQVLNLSPWNPPPGNRKLHGDLLYLYCVTTEGRKYYITSSTLGFYVNLSTDEEFVPFPSTPSYLSHSLIDLLNQLSPTFKRHFANLQKKRTSRHPFERVSTPYQVFTWCSPQLNHYIDSLRAEDAFSSKLGYEEHIPGQTRDWNEELQTTRELPRTTLPERLLRERAIFKVHSDFVSAATRGAVSVVDGNVMAINPGEDPTMQMFIWNNIFFSLGFDVKDHYKELGGNAAAFVAPKNDLQGVKVYNTVDMEGLYTLGTVVVDYRGSRVTAQSIIPGILEKEQEQSVVYGSIDFGKTVVSHPKYLELLKSAGEALRIAPHNVKNDKNEEVQLCSSIECKGIIGNDGRHYILDLLRTFPPDVNFLTLENVSLGEVSKKMGFPIKHKHKLATLRLELIEAFVESRYLKYLQTAALHLQKQSTDKKELTESELSEEIDTLKKEEQRIENANEVARKAAKSVGSIKENKFDIKFNPDVFSPFVRHANENSEDQEKERQLVIDAADFLVATQIPLLVSELNDHSSAPTDGYALCDLMHARGINIRYLGKIADSLKGKEELYYIFKIAVTELLCRSVRHVFFEYMQQKVDSKYTATAVAHFLNCYLSSCSNPHPPMKTEEVINRKKKRKNGFSTLSQCDFALLNPKQLWQKIKNEMKSYFDFDLKADSAESVFDTYKIQKISLLRGFCIKCGIQVLLRDYNFDTKNESFDDEDIVNIFPVTKHINPKATDAYSLYTAGQAKIHQGNLKEGYELISEALNFLNNVYGAMHPEIAQCLRMLARICYIMGDYVEALSYQQKATLMSERVNGIDHPFTISEYINLSLYYFANRQVSISLKLLYRARYLVILIYGEDHPEVALIDSNIGLILHAESQYSLSLQFLEKSLELNILFYGANSLKVALSNHLVARTQSCMGDFRAALKYEKETFAIYKEHLGENHEKTKEADECLRHLTQQAVVMAKKINEVIQGKAGMGLPPIQIQPPSMANVLELLNITNGILYIHITPAEIEKLKLEISQSKSKENPPIEKEDDLLEVTSSSHSSQIDLKPESVCEA